MFDIEKNYSSLNSLNSLQENGGQFFTKIFQKYPDSFSCKEGCSKCCYVDLSVFEIEAAKIVDWFNSLSGLKQDELKQVWRSSTSKNGENANGELNTSCAFLIEEKCSIYEARPLICRTQGAPLYFQELNRMDVCPLNFSSTEKPPKEDWLNVDRLNMLLGLVQNQFAKEAQQDSANRISLNELKNLLMQ